MKALKYGLSGLAVCYIILIGLNLTIGYRQCKALNINNDLNEFNPCGIAYNIRN